MGEMILSRLSRRSPRTRAHRQQLIGNEFIDDMVKKIYHPARGRTNTTSIFDVKNKKNSRLYRKNLSTP
jgi:hypothetical protein